MNTQIEDQIDYEFIMRVQAEVTTSCALPFPLPADRIPEFILQAAQWFWANDDWSGEERYYVIPNSEICKGNKLNKIVQLPKQILGVHGCFRLNDSLRYGPMGDFSIERMMMSSYANLGGMGNVGGGFGQPSTGYTLQDVVAGLYEIDTFNQMLNPPLTYNFNQNSHKLVILGDLGYSDLLIQCYKRCRIQDMYDNYYFFRLVTVFCRRALSMIYGTYEFKLPGGVTINYSSIKDAADADFEEVKEYVERNRSNAYFMQPNTI